MTTTHNHSIETTAKLFLEWDEHRWIVSPILVHDSHPLDAVNLSLACSVPHGNDEAATTECFSELNIAAHTDLPKAKDLIGLIAEQLSPDELLDVLIGLHAQAQAKTAPKADADV